VITRFGVIGTGAWGCNYLRVLTSHPGAQLVAVADPDPETRGRVNAICSNVSWSADPNEVLNDSRVDAIVIASPAPTHAALAIAAIRADKHVLVEKPLALSLEDAASILAAHRQNAKRVAMVGHLMVFHPAVTQLRKLLRSGDLGQLRYLHSTRVNLGRLRTDENALWSFGPHDLSMIDYLLERQPDSVTARGQCVLQPGIEDVVFLTLRYASGEMAHLHLSWLNPRKERRLTLVCSKKMVEFDDVALEKLRIHDRGFEPAPFTRFSEFLTIRDGDVFIPTVPMEEPLMLEIQHFLDCIERRRKPITDLESGLRVVSILDAATQSLAGDGAPVTLRKSA
jgi:predicted dehydrogenase